MSNFKESQRLLNGLRNGVVRIIAQEGSQQPLLFNNNNGSVVPEGVVEIVIDGLIRTGHDTDFVQVFVKKLPEMVMVVSTAETGAKLQTKPKHELDAILREIIELHKDPTGQRLFFF